MFSFAVIMYELFAKAMLVFTELPVGTTDPTAPDRYADNVAGGYRPRKTSAIDPDIWQLINEAWDQEPLERPCMTEVGGGAGVLVAVAVAVVVGVVAGACSCAAGSSRSQAAAVAGRPWELADCCCRCCRCRRQPASLYLPVPACTCLLQTCLCCCRCLAEHTC